LTPEDIDMSETFGLTLHKSEPLRAIPMKTWTYFSAMLPWPLGRGMRYYALFPLLDLDRYAL
jgi:hypothetical protein